MSSCLSGGGRAYNYKLNLELIKPQTSSWTSNSPSSTSSSSALSESNNSPLTISTRKTRTPRKRPNQTYNEAASILSTAYPKLFPTKHLTKPCKFTKPPFEPSSDLLMPLRVIDNSEYLLERPGFSIEPKSSNSFEKPCRSPGEINSQEFFSCDGIQEDFDAESMLDEDVGEGIDSIMGNLSVEKDEKIYDSNSVRLSNTCCYGYPVGLGFDFRYGMRNEMRAMRDVDDKEDDWWRFPGVNVADITRKIAKMPVEKKSKKKSLDSGKQNSFVGSKASEENVVSRVSSEEAFRRTHGGHMLKLNYDDVLRAWADKGSPFSGGGAAAEGDGVQVRLAQIDLFAENDAPRDAIVLRYKEKRRSRLFSKKIRYQVRKIKADQRPRIKGRFVRSPNSPSD